MNLSKLKKLTTILLVLAFLLLAGCSGAAEEAEAEGDYVEGTIAGEELGTTYAADDVFSLNSCAAAGFNPYTTKNSDNRLLDGLVYENLFEVDDDFNLSSRIVTKWESVEDGAYWYFTIDTSIEMHDGETLTAQDVSYSLQRAIASSRYSGRFSYVWGVSASNGDTVSVTLSAPNQQFPYLLTIPVIKHGSISENTPAGTGPYRFSEDLSRLEAFQGYPDWKNLPVDTIGLKEYDSIEDTITAYEDSYIDLVVNDPSGITNLGYGGSNETRYFVVNNMHYLAFNMDSEVNDFIHYGNYRYALQYAVDRETAAKTYMQGSAVAAALPISPNSPLFNEELASDFNFDLDRCLLILNNSGVKDYDDDGKLEYMITGIPMEISLDLIVCSEASGKADVAKKFAADLASIGVTVNVRELSWDDYIAALQEGDFDIYYGEVKLTADFSLTRLLTEEGDLNYCGIDDPTYGDYISQYLAAGDDMRQTCCDIMLHYITETAPMISICFERQEVITHRNIVSGLNPSQYNVFFGLGEWAVNIE